MPKPDKPSELFDACLRWKSLTVECASVAPRLQELRTKRERFDKRRRTQSRRQGPTQQEVAELRLLEQRFAGIAVKRAAFRAAFVEDNWKLLTRYSRQICSRLNHPGGKCTAGFEKTPIVIQDHCQADLILAWVTDQILGHERGELIGTKIIKTSLKGKLRSWFDHNAPLPELSRVPFDRFLMSILHTTTMAYAEHNRSREGAQSNFVLNNGANSSEMRRAWLKMLEADDQLNGAAQRLRLDKPSGGKELAKALYIDAARNTDEWLQIRSVAATIVPGGATIEQLDALSVLAPAWDAELRFWFELWHTKYLDKARAGHTLAIPKDAHVLAEVIDADDPWNLERTAFRDRLREMDRNEAEALAHLLGRHTVEHGNT